MPESRTPFDHELELRALHVRAYGPEPDIQDDPAALARLAELEAARAAAASAAASASAPPETGDVVPVAPDSAGASPAAAMEPAALPAPEPASSPPSAPRSLARRLTSSPSRLVAVATVAGLAVIAIAFGVATLLGPRPDATLSPTGNPVDDALIGLVRNSGAIDIDLSTLQSFETFRGVEPWSAVDAYGNPCLILIERSRERLVDAQCTPPEAELVADYGAWPALGPASGLPDGSIVRFHHRDDTVEVFVHPAQARD